MSGGAVTKEKYNTAAEESTKDVLHRLVQPENAKTILLNVPLEISTAVVSSSSVRFALTTYIQHFKFISRSVLRVLQLYYVVFSIVCICT